MNGLFTLPSQYSVNETTEKIVSFLDSNGITLFAAIDHSRNAIEHGLFLRPNQLLIFGSPMTATPLMVDQPSTGIDLPLKILVWEDESDNVWLTCNDMAWIGERHGLSETGKETCMAIGDKLASLIHKVVF
jgi:uncharacterized protein (DUF302 family)